MSMAMFASCELLQSSLGSLRQQAENLSAACEASLAGIRDTASTLQAELQSLGQQIEAANDHLLQCQQEYGCAAAALEQANNDLNVAEYELSCAQSELEACSSSPT